MDSKPSNYKLSASLILTPGHDSKLIQTWSTELHERASQLSLPLLINSLTYLNENHSLDSEHILKTYEEIFQRRQIATLKTKIEFLNLKIGEQKAVWVKTAEALIPSVIAAISELNLAQLLELRSALKEIHQFRNTRLPPLYAKLTELIGDSIRDIERTSTDPNVYDTYTLTALITELPKESGNLAFWRSHFDVKIRTMLPPPTQTPYRPSSLVPLLVSVHHTFSLSTPSATEALLSAILISSESIKLAFLDACKATPLPHRQAVHQLTQDASPTIRHYAESILHSFKK